MNSQNVGKMLRERREQRGLTLEAAGQATKIRVHYLQALEAGEFSVLPSAAQVRGFLRAYAEYLELNPEELLSQLKGAQVLTSSEETESAPPFPKDSQRNQQTPEAFAAIGDELQTRREQMQLTLLEAEENTHIPEHYLARLEKGELDNFPSPTQARGMLANYAEFLGLESEALLMRYAEALQQRFQARAAEKPVRRKPVRPTLPPLKFRLPEWAQPFLTRDIAFGALAGFGLLVFLLFSIGRILTTQAAQVDEPTAPPLVGLLIPTSVETVVVTPGAGDSINLLDQPTATAGLIGQATIEATGTGNINVRLLALQRTWMRVTVDGRKEFEGRTVPGQSYSFSANGQILLFTGNGSALRIFFNDQDLGILGIFGEVVNVVFNAQGAATPTVSPSPTIDPNILTSTANAALTPSATPSPSPTETPSPTIDSSGANP